MKKMLLFILCTVMLLQGICMPVSADGGFVLTNMPGVYLTSNKTMGSGDHDIYNLIDSVDTTNYMAEQNGKYSHTDAYVQVNFPVNVSINKIRIFISTGCWYGVKDINVSLSDTADFSEKETVYYSDDMYLNSDDDLSIPAYQVNKKNGEIIIDVSPDTPSYKYLRISQNGNAGYFCFSEITVWGGEADIENISFDGERLTDYPDTDPAVSGCLSAYLTNGLTDGDFYTEAVRVRGVGTYKYAWVRIDLARPAVIEGIKIRPTDESLQNNNFIMFLSNKNELGDDILSSGVDISLLVKEHKLVMRYGAGTAAGGSMCVKTDTSESYRYVWVLANDFNKELCLNEIEVYGRYLNSAGGVKNLAPDAVIKNHPGGNVIYELNDNDLSSDWIGENESVIIDLQDSYNISKIGVLPSKANREAAGAVDIELSNDENFEESVKIYSAENEFPVTKITFLPVDENYDYRYIRISKNAPGLIGFAELRIITEDSSNRFFVTGTNPADGFSEASNINVSAALTEGADISGEYESVTITFSKLINESTVSNETILLERIAESGAEKIAYGAGDYFVDGKTFGLKLAALESAKRYRITVTDGVCAYNGDCLSEEYVFSFGTAGILKEKLDPEAALSNIALNKSIIYYNDDETPVEGYHDIYVTDGLDTNGCVMNISDRGKYSYIVVDLLNVYDLYALEIRQRRGMGHDLKNAEVVAADSLCPVEDMQVLDTFGASGAEGDTYTLYFNDYMGKYRYVGVRRINDPVGVGVAELKAWAYTTKDFGNWRAEYDGKKADNIEAAGQYTLKGKIRNIKKSDEAYGFFIAMYDKENRLVGMRTENLTVRGQSELEISEQVSITSEVSAVKCILVNNTAQPSMSTDCFILSKSQRKE
ncbi:MAG: Ig-like domain-containing protein [Clostridia bacterium]|nr:Ig-like domain-containing protein [Clostridia bacterium]